MKTPPLFLGLDIETLPGEKPTKEELKPPGTLKKAESIQAWLDNPENIDVAHRKQSLDSLKGQVFIIGYAFDNDDIQVLYNENEADLLEDFAKVIGNTQNGNGLIWYGHNMKFDLKFLYHKALKYNSSLLKYIPNSIRSSMVRDTSSLFSMDIYGEYYKLSDIAKYLGIEGKYEGITGAMVYDLWIAGEIEKLKLYCMDDVRITRDIFSRLSNDFKFIYK